MRRVLLCGVRLRSLVMLRVALLVVLVVLGAVLGACGDDGDPADDMTLTEYCVEQVERFYVQNDLPFTSDPEDRDEICEEWMAEHDVTTKAEIQVVLRQLQKELDG